LNDGHEWQEYDPFHRACVRCGLRLFMAHRDGRVKGWQTVDWRGVPGPLMIAARGGGWGQCSPPPAPPIPEPVIIEYTGDPDQHPGCERIMHAAGGLSGSAGGLVAVTGLTPACGVLPSWWELGPARAWHGWNWCPECFPGKTPVAAKRSAHLSRPYPGFAPNRDTLGPTLGLEADGHRAADTLPPALPAAKPKTRSPKKGGKHPKKQVK